MMMVGCLLIATRLVNFWQHSGLHPIDIPVVTVPFLTASLLGYLFSDMVRVVDCHAGALGSNPGRSKYFPLGITSLVAAVIR